MPRMSIDKFQAARPWIHNPHLIALLEAWTIWISTPTKFLLPSARKRSDLTSVIILKTTDSNKVPRFTTSSMLVTSGHAPVNVTLAKVASCIECEDFPKDTRLGLLVSSYTDNSSLTIGRLNHEARQTTPSRLLRARIWLQRFLGLKRGIWALPRRPTWRVVSPRHPHSVRSLLLARKSLHRSTEHLHVRCLHLSIHVSSSLSFCRERQGVKVRRF